MEIYKCRFGVAEASNWHGMDHAVDLTYAKALDRSQVQATIPYSTAIDPFDIGRNDGSDGDPQIHVQHLACDQPPFFKGQHGIL